MSRFIGVPSRDREKVKTAQASRELTARFTVEERIKKKINKERRAERHNAKHGRRRQAGFFPA